MQTQQRVARSLMLAQTQYRLFGATQKLANVELTIRTPYRTLFQDFSGYSKFYANTIKGRIGIGNKSHPRVWLLPPGEVEVQGAQEGEGNFTNSSDGKFMHTGGWCFVHDNNSIEVNLLECCEKDKFRFDAITAETEETDSAAGRVAAQLQDQTYKLFQRRR